jgi:hypothetical protein
LHKPAVLNDPVALKGATSFSRKNHENVFGVHIGLYTCKKVTVPSIGRTVCSDIRFPFTAAEQRCFNGNFWQN